MLSENIKWNEKQHATNNKNIFMHHIFANPRNFYVNFFIEACLSYKHEFILTNKIILSKIILKWREVKIICN